MGSALGLHALVRHPDTPASYVSAVKAQLTIDERRRLWIEYSVASVQELVVPPGKPPGRGNDLWATTCFELFVKSLDSESYLEFNFSPSFQWAAYEFSGYRRGKREFPTHDPEIWLSQPGDWLFLAVEALPDFSPEPLKIGVSAVIEERDGTKSYWALAHPPGDPDFHDPDCFRLDLPPPESA